VRESSDAHLSGWARPELDLAPKTEQSRPRPGPVHPVRPRHSKSNSAGW